MVDGGYQGWLRVLGAHLLYISSWGLLSAYGVFVDYYSMHLLPGYSKSALAWPGTLQAVLIIAVGVLTGPLFDRGYLASLIMLGSFLVVFGMMMLSLSTEYYQIVLSQGICVGLGNGIMYVPSITLVSVSFEKWRTTAIALTICGSSVGGVVFPILFQTILPRIGFAWATRVLGFVALFCCLTGGTIIIFGRKSLAPKSPRSLFELSSLRDGVYASFNLALFFIFMSFFIPLFYIPDYVTGTLEDTPQWAVYTLAILNTSFFASRLTAAYAAEKLGPGWIFIASAASSAIILLCWIAIKAKTSMKTWVVFFGLLAGPITMMPAAMLPSICPEKNRIGTRLGMAWLFAALGCLVGTPIAGAFITQTSNGFLGAQVFAGTTMCVGGLLLLPSLRFAVRQQGQRNSRD